MLFTSLNQLGGVVLSFKGNEVKKKKTTKKIVKENLV